MTVRMTPNPKSRFRVICAALVFALLPLTLSACATEDETGTQNTPSITVPDGVDPVRVALAIVLLNSGDIDAAIAAGQVSPAEVDLAIQAITEDTVTAWLDLAEEATSKP